MKNKKGFVFIETIIVVCVLLASLMVIYSMYVSSVNANNRGLRFDDTAKLYEAYYVYKYLDSFDLDILKDKIRNGSFYEIIYPGRSDIFGSSYSEEAIFFDDLWMKLNIKNIYFLPPTISELVQCNASGLETICSNNNLVTYLKNIDNGANNTFLFVVEYATTKGGSTCTANDCFYYYSYMMVGA